MDDSPLKKGGKAIIIRLPKEKGKWIEKGATVMGELKQHPIFPHWDAEPFWNNFEKKFQGFLQEFQKIPEYEQYKNLKNKLSELESQMEESGKGIADKVQEEILRLN